MGQFLTVLSNMNIMVSVSLLCLFLSPLSALPSYSSLPDEHLSPHPFSYQYQVQDAKTNNIFSKTESQTPDGTVSGSFRISLPDGGVQTTTYHADHYEGFTAQVEYAGSASYPVHQPARQQPYHRPAQYQGRDRLVLSYTPSPYVAAKPYKSSLAFPTSLEDEEEEENKEEEAEVGRRRYRIY